jgi:hypothetical protein
MNGKDEDIETLMAQLEMIKQVQVQEQGWGKKHKQAWMMKLNNNLYKIMNYLELHK